MRSISGQTLYLVQLPFPYLYYTLDIAKNIFRNQKLPGTILHTLITYLNNLHLSFQT